LCIVLLLSISAASTAVSLGGGPVELDPDETLNITPVNSTETYEVPETTVLGALDAASVLGAFEYQVAEDLPPEEGNLSILSITGIENELVNETPSNWTYWLNGEQGTTGPAVTDVTDGDNLTFSYGPPEHTIDDAAYTLTVNVSVVGAPPVNVTPTPTGNVTPTPTGNVTPTPTVNVTPTPTVNVTPTVPVAGPDGQYGPGPIVNVTPTPTVNVTPTPTVNVTPTPAVNVTPTPTVNVTPAPGANVTPAVSISDQPVVNATVVVDNATINRTGWADIHADLNGTPGPIIGYSPISEGVNENVTVAIEVENATPVLYAMLHVDEGEPGVHEFPGPDVPILVNGSPVQQAFSVTGGLPTVNVTPTPTVNVTPSPTVTGPDGQYGPGPTVNVTPTPTVNVTPTPTVNVTPTPTVNVTPTPTVNVTPTPTVNVTPTPTVNVTPTPTVNVTPTPTVNVTPTPTVNVTPTPTVNVTPPPTPAAEANVTIVEPMEGANVTAGNVTVSVDVANFTLVEPTGQPNAPGEGHLHYYLDAPVPTNESEPAIPPTGGYVISTNLSHTWENVTAGEHNLSVQLVNNDHTPLIPLVFETVNVTATEEVNVTPTPTVNVTPTPTVNVTPTPTVNVTPTPTVNVTPTPTVNVTPTPTVNVTPTPTVNVTPTPTVNVTPTPTVNVTPTPTVNVTPTPTVNVTPTPTVNVTPTPTVNVTPTPTVNVTPTPTPEVDIIEEIVAGLSGQENLTTFVGLVNNSTLGERLEANRSYVVCAPTNEAFDELGNETLSTIMNNTTLLNSILEYHVILGDYTIEDLVMLCENSTNGQISLPTVEGSEVNVSLTDGQLLINNITVVTQIQITNNIVVYVLDGVLVPPDTPIPTPTPTPTVNVTPTPTVNVTPTPTVNVTPTPTVNVTPTPTVNVTPTPTVNVTPTPTVNVTPTPTVNVTPTPTVNVTPTPTVNVTPTPTVNVTPTPTVNVTPTPTVNVTPTPTVNVTPTPTVNVTPTPTVNVTPTPTVNVTPTPTVNVTPTPTVNVTPTPTVNVTPTPTVNVTPTPTVNVTPTPTVNVTPTPTVNVTPTPTVNVTPTPTPVPPGETVELQLYEGWNFVSIPRQLSAGNDTAGVVFADVDTGGRPFYTHTPAGGFEPLGENETLMVLEGYWVYSTEETTVELMLSTDPVRSPAVKTLSPGWNAIGYSDLTERSANNALTSVEDIWVYVVGYDAENQSYRPALINNVTGAQGENQRLSPTEGYWLFVREDGRLAAISA